MEKSARKAEGIGGGDGSAGMCTQCCTHNDSHLVVFADLLYCSKAVSYSISEQAQTWLREAARCMREYRLTRALLDAGASKMAEQEERITALNRRLEERSTIPSFFSVRIVLLLLAAIVLVAAALYLGGGKSPPARHAL